MITTFAANPDLPQLSSCGPIEADGQALNRVHPFLLPQLSSCGPIEAPTSRAGRRAMAAPSATVKLRPH